MLRRTLILSGIALAGLFCCHLSAQAQTVDSGNVKVQSLTNVTPNNAAAEDDAFAKVFRERTQHTLSQNLSVDLLNPLGSYDANSVAAGSILKNTIVDSYWLNADRVGSVSQFKFYSGQITFQRKIIGLIFNTQSRFHASTLELGRIGTTYPASGAYGPLEKHDSQHDTFSVTNGGKTLTFNWKVNTHADQMRIITEAVPEPAFYQMSALIAGGGLLLWRHRRKRA
jgi:hypothetical protein